MSGAGMAAAAAAALRQARAIARADLLERVRRYSYLMTLAGTLYFVYLVNYGNVRLTIHGQRGVFNSAWVGTLMALSVGAFLSLLGFYLVKNTLDRDRRTGVGEILAATPMSRAAYTAGKALSNFLLLSSILALLVLAAGITQLLSGEETHLDAAALLAPMALLALPPVALAAALAVLFETVRWLRGSLGNVAYFCLWAGGLAFAAIGPAGDSLGFHLVETSFARQLPARAVGGTASRAAGATAADTGIALNVGPSEWEEKAAGPGEPGKAAETARLGDRGQPMAPQPAAAAAGGTGRQASRSGQAWPRPPRRGGVRWNGVEWTAAVVGGRLAWLAAALAVALLAAVPFSRFDPAREAGRRRRGAPTPDPTIAGHGDLAAAANATMTAGGPVTVAAGVPEGLTARLLARSMANSGRPRQPAPSRTATDARGAPWAAMLSRAANLVSAELRLMLRGRSRWWFAGAAALLVAGLAVPAGEARAALLALAWIWPLPLWSELGVREAQHGTAPLILSAPLPPVLQSAAIWAAGACVTALAGGGVGLRLALSGDAGGLAAWTVGCLFIPALAFALGTLSGSPRLFEVVYLLLWYAGPMNHVAQLDYTGATPAARTAGVAWLYLGLTLPLFTVAWAARSRRARG